MSEQYLIDILKKNNKKIIIGIVVSIVAIWLFDSIYYDVSFMIARGDVENFVSRVEAGKIEEGELTKEDVIEAITIGDPQMVSAVLNYYHQCSSPYTYQSHDIIRAIAGLEDHNLQKEYYSRFKRTKDGRLKVRNARNLFLNPEKDVIKSLLLAGFDPNEKMYIETNDYFISGAYLSKILVEYQWTVENVYTPQGVRSRPILKPFLKMDFKDLPVPAWYSSDEIKALYKGKGVNYKKKKYKIGTYPILMAVRKRAKDIVKLLLDFGAEDNVVSDNGETVYSLTDDPNLLFLLRSKGKPVTASRERVIRNDLKSYQQYFQSISEKDRNRIIYRDFHIAVESGSGSIAAYLAAKGAKLNKSFEWKYLLNAYESRSPLIMDLVINMGANPNLEIAYKDLPQKYQPGEDGALSILFKSTSGKRLKSKAQKLQEKASIGKILTGIARKERQMTMAFVINSHLYQWSDFLLYALAGNFDESNALLKKNPALLNKSDLGGRSPLSIATFYSQTKTVNYLIEKGSNLDHLDKNGNSALIEAVRIGNLELVKLLTDHGAGLGHQKVKNCAYALTYAEKTHRRYGPYEKILGAFKAYRGSKTSRKQMRFREVFHYLKNLVEEKGIKKCKTSQGSSGSWWSR
ncbi:MAG: ankyrin repeat domain-containing protein [Proteobacteria bacterium]|nr:ankyrin repeat domain-containing protein [Pseudomonadota bacterium]